METNVNPSASISPTNQDGWSLFVAKTKQRASPMIHRGEAVYCRLCAEQVRKATPTMHYCSVCDTGFCSYHGNYSRGIALCTECGYTRKSLINLIKRRFKISQDLIDELTK